jgi:hypothetical protein
MTMVRFEATVDGRLDGQPQLRTADVARLYAAVSTHRQ